MKNLKDFIKQSVKPTHHVVWVGSSHLVKNKTPYKVTNVGIRYNYKEKKYELFNK